MLTQVTQWWETFQRQMIVVDIFSTSKPMMTIVSKYTKINPSTYISPIYLGLHLQSSLVTFNLNSLLVASCFSWVKSGMYKVQQKSPKWQHSNSPYSPATSEPRWLPFHVVAAASWQLARHWFGLVSQHICNWCALWWAVPCSVCQMVFYQLATK